MRNIFFIIFFFALAVASYGAETYSVTVPAGTEVVMEDPDAVIPVTITNNPGSSKDIREITFSIDSAKYAFSSSIVPPAGWCVRSYSTAQVTFALTQAGGSCSSGSTGSQIAPGSSLVFNIVASPAASSADVTGDSFTSVVVDTQGGFSLSGGLPTWVRRSFEASLEATPSTAGAGDAITLSMQVINRSTAAQTGVTTAPGPPSASSAIVTFIDGPYYGSTALSSDHSATVTTVSVGSASEFAPSGTALIEDEEVCYTGKTATTLTGVTRGCNGTTAAAHTTGAAVYSLDAFSLASGEARTLVWKYRADSSGSVYFSARASNGGGTANSISASSNTVVIGDFTALLAVSPASLISGQQATVEMTVTNNGSSALINVVPSALTGCAGGAAETYSSGPSPSSISSIAPGSSGTFIWTYTITGSLGQAYCLSGSSSANGPISTNTATSNRGAVSVYSATVTPAAVASGSTNKTFTWTVHNGGGCTVKEVDIAIPSGAGEWSCSSTTPPSGWSGGCSSTVQFQSSGPSDDIASGTSKSFSITFSSTKTVTSDEAVEFDVLPIPRGCGGGTPGTIGTYITVSAYGLSLTHSPAGPIYADGNSIYAMTATLTSGGSPVAGKTVTFSAANGSLSPSTAVTDSSGVATVNLIAPNSTTNTSATVVAEYFNAGASDTVNFTGWTKANLQYWGELSHVTVECGTSYTISMKVTNISTASMTLGTGSYFAFNDFASGGSTVFQAYLNTASAITVNGGDTVTLEFGSPTSAGGGGGVAVETSFITGSYLPTLNSAPPPASGLFLTDGGTNDQYRSVTDIITVAGSCGAVKVYIIDWHEIR